jgi:leader peptidase (prepilin peptidase)/N-methyltransferase
MGTDTMVTTPGWETVPFHFWSVMFFIFGCVIGSFLNVCIYRMPREMSIVHPPSHCPHCRYAIPFYLNIPLVTWLVLGGRCKNCGAPISFRYFLVELLTGLMFLSSWLRFGDQANPLPSIPLAAVFAIFLAGLMVATFIDFEHFIIPDEITLGGAALGFAVSFFLPAMHDTSSVGTALFRSALGIAVGAGIVYAILRLGKLMFGRHRLKLEPGTKVLFTETSLCLGNKEIPWGDIFYRKSDTIMLVARRVEMVDRGYAQASIRLSPSLLEIDDEKMDPDGVGWLEAECDEIVLPREAMGLGDVKFMGAIGAFIGWQGAVFSLMASSLIGATIGVALIAMRRREWSSRMPYGPYIALAAVVWVFAGKRILALFFPQMG